MTAQEAILKVVGVIVDPIIKLAFAAALMYFFWGIFKMIMAVSNGEDTNEGKRNMLWGLIGMVIMFSVGGIISIVNNTVGADQNQQIQSQGGFQ